MDGPDPLGTDPPGIGPEDLLPQGYHELELPELELPKRLDHLCSKTKGYTLGEQTARSHGASSRFGDAGRYGAAGSRSGLVGR